MQERGHLLRLAAILASLALFAVGCYAEPVALTTFPPTSIPRVTILAPSQTPSFPAGSPARPTGVPAETKPAPTPTTVEPSTPPATSTPMPLSTPSPSVPGGSVPPASGPPAAGCVNGWIAAQPGSAEYEEGFAILSDYMGVTGEWEVAELRYFTGPESPGIIEPRYDVVERWYIRAGLVVDPTFRGRWILEKRTDQVLGVSAVAPYETTGYASPDWTAFVGEGPPSNYLGLPGQWSGIPYDFVTGEGDSGNPGLPSEVIDCLLGT